MFHSCWAGSQSGLRSQRAKTHWQLTDTYFVVAYFRYVAHPRYSQIERVGTDKVGALERVDLEPKVWRGSAVRARARWRKRLYTTMALTTREITADSIRTPANSVEIA